MNVNTGKLFQGTETDIVKMCERRDMVRIAAEDMTDEQRKNMQVELDDKVSVLGKRRHALKKLSANQLKRQRKKLAKKYK